MHTTQAGREGKECSSCETWKPLSEYAPRKKGRDGLRGQCRSCRQAVLNAYYRTEHGQASIRKAQRKYYNSEKDLARRQRHHQTEKWRVTNRRSVQVWQNRNPIKKKAAHTVHYAVTKGDLPNAASCACVDCSAQAEEYHHESYKPEHWLDVVPLCRRCHMIRHGRDVC